MAWYFVCANCLATLHQTDDEIGIPCGNCGCPPKEDYFATAELADLAAQEFARARGRGWGQPRPPAPITAGPGASASAPVPPSREGPAIEPPDEVDFALLQLLSASSERWSGAKLVRDLPHAFDRDERSVTARLNRMKDAGWVEHNDKTGMGSRWWLTPSGRTLAEAKSESLRKDNPKTLK